LTQVAVRRSSFRQLWSLLRRPQRRTAVVLVGLMLIGMVLETLSTSLVMPALGLLTTKDLAARYPAVAPALRAMGNPTQAELVVAGMLALVVVFVIKAAFLGFLAWRQARFAFGLQADLSERLFTGYLRQPWTFHLQRNSAQLMRNATTEVGLFTSVILSIMLVMTEVLVAFGVSVLLLLVEPVGAVVVISTLSLAAWFFYRFTRTHLLRWGKARQQHEGQRIQHLQQGLGGAKEVKLLGREEEFFAQYRLHNSGGAGVQQHLTTVQQLPRLWLELLAAVGLASLVLIMVRSGKPLDTLLPTVGLFVVAAFRMMPSMSRLMTSSQVVRYNRPVISLLYQEIAELSMANSGHPVSRSIPFEREVRLHGVSYRYPGSESFALHNVSLAISRGASVGFVGESGAGKSTLVDLVLGLLTPTHGSVTVDGVNIQDNLRGWQNQVGYVPQAIFLTDDSLRRNVAFGLPDGEIDDARLRRALRAAQLEEFVESLPNGVDTVVGERGVRLSGGQRQRIGIARALYHDPPVLVLDEATSSLDTANEQGVMAAVNALHGKKTLLIVAHRLSTVSTCDRLFRLEQGELVETGNFETVATRRAHSGR
jgi:ABC-type multidrug transport system fused ATPase/permease subunit